MERIEETETERKLLSGNSTDGPRTSSEENLSNAFGISLNLEKVYVRKSDSVLELVDRGSSFDGTEQSSEPQNLNDNIAIDLDPGFLRPVSSKDSLEACQSSVWVTALFRDFLDEELNMSMELVDDSEIKLCRICQNYVEQMKLLPCPCECRGSVGFVHLSCWKDYLAFNDKGLCEICKKPYVIQRNFERLIANLFDRRCMGTLMKSLAVGLPLAVLMKSSFIQDLLGVLIGYIGTMSVSGPADVVPSLHGDSCSGSSVGLYSGDMAGTSVHQSISNRIIRLDFMSPMMMLAAVSSNQLHYPCRICRSDETDGKIVRCPCKCKGSVGFVHIKCLRQWILLRHGSRCEVCNTKYRLPSNQVGTLRMLRLFLSAPCAGQIVKNFIYVVSLVPLARIVLHQVLSCMEKINIVGNSEPTMNGVLIALCALFTSSALFFNFFDYFTDRFLEIGNIVNQWWIFGDLDLLSSD